MIENCRLSLINCPSWVLPSPAVDSPFDSGRGLAAEAAEKFARVARLHHARPQLERERGRRLGGFLPERVR